MGRPDSSGNDRETECVRTGDRQHGHYSLNHERGVFAGQGPVQRQTAGLGGLLQLPSASRGARWTDTVRTTTLEDDSSSVNDLLRPYIQTLTRVMLWARSEIVPLFVPPSRGAR